MNADLVITEEPLRALPVPPERPPLCLLCRHGEGRHLLLPPNDRRARSEIAHYHRLATGAHAQGKGHNPKRVWYLERQCIVGATTRGVCGCAKLILTEAELAEYRAFESKAYQPPVKERSPESDGRSKSNQEIRALERAMNDTR